VTPRTSLTRRRGCFSAYVMSACFSSSSIAWGDPGPEHHIVQEILVLPSPPLVVDRLSQPQPLQNPAHLPPRPGPGFLHDPQGSALFSSPQTVLVPQLALSRRFSYQGGDPWFKLFACLSLRERMGSGGRRARGGI